LQFIQRLKTEPWREVDAHNRGLEVKKRALESLKNSGRRFPHVDEEQDSDKVFRMRIGSSGFNQVGGSGSGREKMTHKSWKN
jgi:hypothetical protein